MLPGTHRSMDLPSSFSLAVGASSVACPLFWSYGLLIVFFALTSGAKPYYVAALYFYLKLAGSVVIERKWLTSRAAPRTPVRTLTSVYSSRCLSFYLSFRQKPCGMDDGG